VGGGKMSREMRFVFERGNTRVEEIDSEEEVIDSIDVEQNKVLVIKKFEEVLKMITLSDLNKNKIMFCLDCESQYSADPIDYFLEKPGHIFSCECGSINLVLI
jgi:hypothetical protein